MRRPVLVALSLLISAVGLTLSGCTMGQRLSPEEHLLRDYQVGLSEAELLQGSAHPHPRARRSSLVILTRRAETQGHPSPSVRQVLVQSLEDPDPEVRAAAAQGMGSLRLSEALPALNRMAGSRREAEAVRVAAIGALGELRDPTSVRPLLQAARNYLSPAVCASATSALTHIRHPDVVPGLIRLLDFQVIVRVDGKPRGIPKPVVIGNATRALRILRVRRAIPYWGELIKDAYPPMHFPPAWALAELDSRVGPNENQNYGMVILLRHLPERLLQRAAAGAIAKVTNRSFGQLDETTAPRTAQRRVKRWMDWYSANYQRTRREWVLDGFRRAGYSLRDLHAVASLDRLISALGDRRPYIQANAVDLLRELTGQDMGANPDGLIPLQPIRVRRWKTWLRANRSRLRWDAAVGRFILH